MACIFALVLYHLREDSSQVDALSAEALELTTRQRLVSLPVPELGT